MERVKGRLAAHGSSGEGYINKPHVDRPASLLSRMFITGSSSSNCALFRVFFFAFHVAFIVLAHCCCTLPSSSIKHNPITTRTNNTSKGRRRSSSSSSREREGSNRVKEREIYDSKSITNQTNKQNKQRIL